MPERPAYSTCTPPAAPPASAEELTVLRDRWKRRARAAEAAEQRRAHRRRHAFELIRQAHDLRLKYERLVRQAQAIADHDPGADHD